MSSQPDPWPFLSAKPRSGQSGLCPLPAWHPQAEPLHGSGGALPTGPSPLGPQVSALRRLAKPMSERVAGRAALKPPMLDSGAEVSASTTSSEAESGARSVSSIVRQWDRKISHFLGNHPSPTGPGTRPAR